MKWLAAACLMLAALTPPASAQTVRLNAAAFEGVWDAHGYSCYDRNGQLVQYDEAVRLYREGGKMYAKKVVGDPCIEAGELTWIVEIGGSTIQLGKAYPAQAHVRRTNGADLATAPRDWVPATITFVSMGRIQEQAPNTAELWLSFTRRTPNW